MKLISCHIDAFGKLKNVDFDFNDEMNVFYEKNGFGKTTLAHFIKAMFYSLPASSKKANFKTDRDLYRPFDFDGKFGGNLKFSCKKGTFIVFRQFGNSPTLDKFYLFDAKTNLISNTFSSNLGDELFGVGRDTFESSTFFGQQNLVSGINDDMRASLSTGVLSGDDIDNFEKAQSLIQKKAKDIRAQVRELKVEDAKDELERAKAKEEVLKIKLDKVEREIKDLSATQRDVERQNKTVNEDAVVAEINKSIAIQSVLETDYARLEEKKNQKSEMLNGVKINSDDYSLLKNLSSISKATFAGMVNYVFIILAILGAIGLVVGGLAKINILLYIGGSVTLLSLFGVIVCSIISKHNADDVKRYHDILKDKNISKNSIEQEVLNFEKVENDVSFIDGEIERLQAGIEKNTFDLQNLRKRFELSYGCKIEDYYLKKHDDKATISNIDKKLIELNNDKKHFLLEIENVQEMVFNLTDIVSSKEEKFVEYQRKLDILTKTAKILEMSRDSISNRFIDPVSNRFNKYYKQFVRDGEDVIIDSNLGMRFGSHFSEVDYLSAGLFDLVYICKRFALADLLFKKEKPAFILDDPFANFDDEKLEIARKILNEMKDEYQIILFTCQKART